MATIYEVAQEAGVSAKTAARILAGESSRPRNRERVLEAVRKLGYVKNQQAASLRLGKSGLIGLIIPPVTNPIYPWLFQAIHDTARERGYQVLVSSVSRDREEVIRSLQMMESNQVEGLLFNMSEWDDKISAGILKRFIARKQPVIVGGTHIEGLEADLIDIKNQEGIAKATNYLIKTGHRRIAFLSGPLVALGNRERLSGFLRAMKEAGLAVRDDWVAEGLADFEAELALEKNLLRGRERPTAVVCATDLIAIRVLRAAQVQGLQVPGDVAVIGFNDIPWAGLSTPSLTTLRLPLRRIAQESIQLLVDRIHNKDVSDPRHFKFDLDLIIRESA